MTLVVDFGTVNTVGMVDGVLVTVDGAPRLPSVVHSGVVGADASLLGRGQEIRDVKARLEPSSVGAVFARMISAAREQGGDVSTVVVTHPFGWLPEQVAVLTAAAAGTSAIGDPTGAAPDGDAAGEGADGAAATGAVRSVRTVVEPVAVVAGVPGGGHAGSAVLVVDAGGGSWDVALVRDRAVVSGASVPVDIDRRIVERVRPSLRSPVDDASRAQLMESARMGKELLSRHDMAEIVLPDHRAVRLTRAEFEMLIAPDVNRLMAAVSSVSAGVSLARVLLVGGAARIPLLALRLSAAVGQSVVPDPEPEIAVVRGAALLG